MARRDISRRAMSLLELAVVLSIVGLLTVAAIGRLGVGTLSNGGAEGYARKLALSLTQARRATISTGDNHFVQLNGSGSVDSFSLIRRASGGEIQVDQTYLVPQDVMVTSGTTVFEFDFEGSALAAYSAIVTGPNRSWTVSVVLLTGAVQVVEST